MITPLCAISGMGIHSQDLPSTDLKASQTVYDTNQREVLSKGPKALTLHSKLIYINFGVILTTHTGPSANEECKCIAITNRHPKWRQPEAEIQICPEKKKTR